MLSARSLLITRSAVRARPGEPKSTFFTVLPTNKFILSTFCQQNCPSVTTHVRGDRKQPLHGVWAKNVAAECCDPESLVHWYFCAASNEVSF